MIEFFTSSKGYSLHLIRGQSHIKLFCCEQCERAFSNLNQKVFVYYLILLHWDLFEEYTRKTEFLQSRFLNTLE